MECVRGPLDILDHAAPRLGAGTKIGFDATRWWPGEEAAGVAGDPVAMPASAAAVAVRLAESEAGGDGLPGVLATGVPEFGGGRVVFVATDAEGREAVEATLAGVRRRLEPMSGAGELLVAVGPAVDTGDWEQVFFHLTANADPGRDAIREAAVAGGAGLAFDATPKRPGPGTGGDPVRDYPQILEMDESIERWVDERASAFGLEPRG